MLPNPTSPTKILSFVALLSLLTFLVDISSSVSGEAIYLFCAASFLLVPPQAVLPALALLATMPV